MSIENEPTYSYVVYNTAGGNLSYALTTQNGLNIEYLEQNDIDVSLNGVLLVLGVGYTFSPNGREILLSSYPGDGAELKIRRYTPIVEPAVEYQPNSLIRSEDLNTSVDQELFANQETRDMVKGVLDGDLPAGNANELDRIDSTGFLQTANIDQTAGGVKTFTKGIVQTGTDAMALPAGPTVARPATGVPAHRGGAIRWNSDSAAWEGLTDEAADTWEQLLTESDLINADTLLFHGPQLNDGSIVPGAVTRPLTDKLEEIVVSVKDFGAKGDWDTTALTGTDDYLAIQTAIDYLKNLPSALGPKYDRRRRTLFFPSGYYKVSQTLIFNGFDQGITVCGESNYASNIVGKTGNGYAIIENVGAARMTYRDMGLLSYCETEEDSSIGFIHCRSTGGIGANALFLSIKNVRMGLVPNSTNNAFVHAMNGGLGSIGAVFFAAEHLFTQNIELEASCPLIMMAGPNMLSSLASRLGITLPFVKFKSTNYQPVDSSNTFSWHLNSVAISYDFTSPTILVDKTQGCRFDKLYGSKRASGGQDTDQRYFYDICLSRVSRLEINGYGENYFEGLGGFDCVESFTSVVENYNTVKMNGSYALPLTPKAVYNFGRYGAGSAIFRDLVSSSKFNTVLVASPTNFFSREGNNGVITAAEFGMSAGAQSNFDSLFLQGVASHNWVCRDIKFKNSASAALGAYKALHDRWSKRRWWYPTAADGDEASPSGDRGLTQEQLWDRTRVLGGPLSTLTLGALTLGTATTGEIEVLITGIDKHAPGVAVTNGVTFASLYKWVVHRAVSPSTIVLAAVGAPALTAPAYPVAATVSGATVTFALALATTAGEEATIAAHIRYKVDGYAWYYASGTYPNFAEFAWNAAFSP